jgi:hypothetical protein
MLFDYTSSSSCTSSIFRYLTAEDITRLDMATTSHALREKLLRYLEESTTLTQFERIESGSMLHYVLFRKIKVGSIIIGIETSPRKEVFPWDGHPNTCVTADQIQISISIPDGFDIFPYIHTINLCNCSRDTVFNVVRKLAIKCPNLKVVTSDTMVDGDLELLAEHCQKLEVLDLNRSLWLDDSINLISNFRSLRQLDLCSSNRNVNDVRSFSICLHCYSKHT